MTCVRACVRDVPSVDMLRWRKFAHGLVYIRLRYDNKLQAPKTLLMRSCKNICQGSVQTDYSSHVVFHAVRAGAYWHKIDGISRMCIGWANEMVHYLVSSYWILVIPIYLINYFQALASTYAFLS